MGEVTRPFWEKPLHALDRGEWEALCDGCGKCCLYRLEDEETGKLEQTNVACKLLNCATGQCSNYPKRKKLVPDCIQLTPAKVAKMNWLPRTCAYRLVHAGKDLPWWHPLKSGSRETVHQAGMSVAGRCISEKEAGELEDHIVYWLDHRGPPRPAR